MDYAIFRKSDNQMIYLSNHPINLIELKKEIIEKYGGKLGHYEIREGDFNIE